MSHSQPLLQHFRVSSIGLHRVVVS